ncbi:MAG: hypothetical protein IPM81_03190 [Saprospirales bacterium]|nr:hypothetical protein [Saprospirales bacterium]
MFYALAGQVGLQIDRCPIPESVGRVVNFTLAGQVLRIQLFPEPADGVVGIGLAVEKVHKNLFAKGSRQVVFLQGEFSNPVIHRHHYHFAIFQ